MLVRVNGEIRFLRKIPSLWPNNITRRTITPANGIWEEIKWRKDNTLYSTIEFDQSSKLYVVKSLFHIFIKNENGIFLCFGIKKSMLRQQSAMNVHLGVASLPPLTKEIIQISWSATGMRGTPTLSNQQHIISECIYTEFVHDVNLANYKNKREWKTHRWICTYSRCECINEMLCLFDIISTIFFCFIKIQ